MRRSSRCIAAALIALSFTGTAIASDQPPLVTIAAIQGASHVSPYERETVRVEGVVTVLAPRGFYLESLRPDEDPATSEAVYVETYRPPGVDRGDLVAITARVAEVYPGGATSGNLPVTTLKRPDIEILESDRPLPDAAVIGTGGRIPPRIVVSNDADGRVEGSRFDPEEDGIDFYESLESMRVVVNEAVSVGTVHTRYGEIWALPDGGAHASVRTPRGGIVVREGDFNPERVLIDYLEDELIVRQPDTPRVAVGDRFVGPIHGVLSYSWYNYKVLPTRPLPAVEPRNLPRERAAEERAPDILSVAAFNVQNLSGRSEAAKFDDIARTVVHGLRAPDLLLLSEIQDSDGPTRSAVVSSAATAERLLEALTAVGGPDDYRYIDIAPEYGTSGGQPHANIRVGFLYRADRVTLAEGSLQQVAPDSPAFANARIPLAARFVFRGRAVLAVANHFSSKGGDGALFGRVQPPSASSESGRIAQAREVHDYVAAHLETNPDALIIAGGDLNDFSFSRSLRVLTGEHLLNPAEALPPGEVYSYIYEGNSQALDHLLVSPALHERLIGPVDYVHRYAEFLYEERFSDHDPLLARFRFE